MSKVLFGAVIGGFIGFVPGILYIPQLNSVETWNRNLFYIILVACGGALLGAVVGSTQAILQGFRERRGRPHAQEPPQAGLFSLLWRKPAGMHPDRWRALQLAVGLVLVVLLVAALLAGKVVHF